MEKQELTRLLSLMFQSHPWHGVSPGLLAPQLVNTYVEIVPRDVVKYELDKPSGHLRLDRPHKFSSLCPTLYGFVPQTYCGTRIAQFCMEKTGRTGIVGDGDPLDICILTEKTIMSSNFFMNAKPIGGLRLLDHGEADDKIIAVLNNDAAFGHFEEINDCPSGLIERLTHYFLSYKQLPNDAPRALEVTHVYSRDEAHEVISLSFQDYRETFGEPESRIEELRTLLRA
ncbi:MAG: inorganic pyrophosphatase [Acidobacteria bacterium]|jgi:inorganic pyrophosphatase|nr:inorganic pyrophosphatase [Acidobacteriota bacterium]